MNQPAARTAPPRVSAYAANDASVLFDICFVLNVNSRGWILEKICQVIDAASGALCHTVFSERNDRLTSPLPHARNYVFVHFSICHFTLAQHPAVALGNVFLWYTHPDLGKSVSRDEIVALVDRCTHVFMPCTRNAETLISWGARGDNFSVILGGADPSLFVPKPRTGQGAVGFVGAYYERKQPDRMLEIIRGMPQTRFLLLGPRPEDVENRQLLWTEWRRFGELRALDNVQYVEPAYEEYPRWYAEMDAYCSVSLVEGGPIPAIEAMMSNVVPVISDTGFARDIVADGKTGHVFDPAAPAEVVMDLLRRALADTTTDVAAVAQAYSWASFGSAIWRRIRGEVAPGERIDLTSEANAVRYLLRGFHAPEVRGVWTRAKQAAISIPLAEGAAPKAVALYAWAPAEREGRPIATHFTINGRPVLDVAVESKAQTYVLPLEPDDGDAARPIILGIATQEMVGPQDRGATSKERRQLGIKIGWIELR